jgi:uncharacterized membrane protein
MSQAVEGPRGGLNIGQCFNDALAVYKASFLALFLAAIVFELLSLLTLLVLCGPLTGGVSLMMLRALRQPDRAAQLGDLFGTFDRFFPLVGVFFLLLILSLLGLAACVIPGLVLMTIWLYPFYLMVDKNMRVFEALGASKDLVLRGGFGKNLLLVLISGALAIGPTLIPYIGPVVSWFLAPLGWLIVTSAYLQQMGDGGNDPSSPSSAG